MATQSFKIDVSKSEVDRLQRKLDDTRLPVNPIVPNAGNDYGPPIDWFHRLAQKWKEDFDWSKIQKHLNRHDHYIANIEDEDFVLDIHFTHTKSSRPSAIPLILVHGWPGSFYEFDRVVDDLVNPANPEDAAFDVVVPSLPGFCWSSSPPRRGWTLQDTARIFNKLMIQLGYTSYVVQAGDWGSFVAREMGARFSECKAVHLNFCPVSLTPEDVDLTPREKKVAERQHNWLDKHLGYAVCMRNRPHTIGVALADNPIGILAWVGEKYEEAVAPDALLDSKWDEAILVQASLYYFTDCIMPSMLPYYENVTHANFDAHFLKEENYIKVPMAYTSFLYDTRPGTKRTAERTGRLVYYNEDDEGGHFAALERPQTIVNDCRKFFKQWYLK